MVTTDKKFRFVPNIRFETRDELKAEIGKHYVYTYWYNEIVRVVGVSKRITLQSPDGTKYKELWSRLKGKTCCTHGEVPQPVMAEGVPVFTTIVLDAQRYRYYLGHPHHDDDVGWFSQINSLLRYYTAAPLAGQPDYALIADALCQEGGSPIVVNFPELQIGHSHAYGCTLPGRVGITIAVQPDTIEQWLCKPALPWSVGDCSDAKLEYLRKEYPVTP